MFGIVFHPQPVGRRRAVPELSVPGVEAKTVGIGHMFLVANRDPQKPSQSQKVTAPSITPSAEGLSIVVDYRLGEYLQVLADVAPIEYHRRATLSGKSKSVRPKKMTWPVKTLLIAVGSAAFFYKVNKVGRCHFKIGAAGIERASKGGTVKAGWPEVVSVWKLSGAYLIQKANGGMPIPFRCMSNHERAEFEGLAGNKLATLASSETLYLPKEGS